MKESVLPIIIIFTLLAAGYFSGKRINKKNKEFISGQTGNIVLILLLCMGIEFGAVFIDGNIGFSIVKNALSLSTIITAITFIFLFKKDDTSPLISSGGHFLSPFKGCAKAFSAFFIGLMIFKETHIKPEDVYLSSSYILYFLIFIVGIDLVNFKITKMSHKIIKIPFFTLLATLLSVVIFAKLSDFTWKESLVASSGFGWFSLSGPMVNQLVSPEMGAMAFMTDFFREMLSIIFLYFLGKSQPRSAIGISGAAALDSALPFIKENCEPVFIKDAIISGFLLTIIAPFLITLAVSLL